MAKKAYYRAIPAVYLVLIKDGKILMLRRFNTGYQDGKYSLPAGHIDGGEPLTKAMVREAKEEIGVKLPEECLRLVHTMHRKSPESEFERLDFFFTADKLKSEPSNQEPHKCDDLSWFPIAKIPSNTIPYIRQAIESITDNIPFSQHGWS